MAVRYNTKGKSFSDVWHPSGGELGLEGGFRVELAEPIRVEFGNEGEARQGDYGAVEVANSEAVVESAEAGARRDQVLSPHKVFRVERGIPVAVHSGSDYPVVAEVVLFLVCLDHSKAAFNQVEVLQKALHTHCQHDPEIKIIHQSRNSSFGRIQELRLKIYNKSLTRREKTKQKREQ